MSRSQRLVFLALPCVALLAGCNEAAKFNQEIIDITQELEATGQEFGEQLSQYAGQRDKLLQLHTEAVRKVQEIVNRGKRLKVPRLKKAKELYQAFRRYLAMEERMVRVEFGGIAYDLGRGDRSRVYDTAMRLQKEELAEVKKIQAAQIAFAEANNLSVEFPAK